METSDGHHLEDPNHELCWQVQTELRTNRPQQKTWNMMRSLQGLVPTPLLGDNVWHPNALMSVSLTLLHMATRTLLVLSLISVFLTATAGMLSQPLMSVSLALLHKATRTLLVLSPISVFLTATAGVLSQPLMSVSLARLHAHFWSYPWSLYFWLAPPGMHPPWRSLQLHSDSRKLNANVKAYISLKMASIIKY